MLVKVNPYKSVCHNSQWYNQGDIFECSQGEKMEDVTVVDPNDAPVVAPIVEAPVEAPVEIPVEATPVVEAAPVIEEQPAVVPAEELPVAEADQSEKKSEPVKEDEVSE